MPKSVSLFTFHFSLFINTSIHYFKRYGLNLELSVNMELNWRGWGMLSLIFCGNWQAFPLLYCEDLTVGIVDSKYVPRSSMILDILFFNVFNVTKLVASKAAQTGNFMLFISKISMYSTFLSISSLNIFLSFSRSCRQTSSNFSLQTFTLSFVSTSKNLTCTRSSSWRQLTLFRLTNPRSIIKIPETFRGKIGSTGWFNGFWQSSTSFTSPSLEDSEDFRFDLYSSKLLVSVGATKIVC